MRTDERLGLDHKIAAAGLSANETTLPRAVHLDARAAKLLKEEREHIEGPSKGLKGPLVLRKPAGGVQRSFRGKEGGKREREEEEEGEVGREEGEISGGEEKRKSRKRRRTEEGGGKRKKGEERGGREERVSKKERRGGDGRQERGGGGEKVERRDAERSRKDEKWRQWCSEEMVEMQPTLDKLQGLQDRVDLGKDKARFGGNCLCVSGYVGRALSILV
jgi:hypothetical protein